MSGNPGAERVRVIVDGRRLQDDALTGAGRAVAAVLPYLRSEFDLTLLTDGRRPAPKGPDRAMAVRAPAGTPELAWLELASVRALRRFDGVFHGTFHTAPLTYRGPQVVTVNDLAPQRHPEDFPWARRQAWRLWVRHAVQRASTVLTISDFVRGELVSHFGIDESRIGVARCGVDPIFAPHRSEGAPDLLARLGVRGRYVCAIGGARRRGLPMAIEAFHQARRAVGGDLSLVVVGTDADRPVDAEGVVGAGFLDDDAWAAVLAGAEALVYPTRYEGFGLPALEAMASGTPVVCAPVASLPEVLGDAGAWAEQPTAPFLAAVLSELLTDDRRRGELRARGLERAAGWPTWADAAGVIADAYRRAWGDR